MLPENARIHPFGSAIRKERGRTPVREAARSAEINQSVWWRIENGERNPLIPTFLKITYSLGLMNNEIINIMGLSVAVEDYKDPQNLWDQLTLAARNPVVSVTGSFGNRVKSYRDGLKLSLRGLSLKTGLYHGDILRYENDQRIPKVSSVARLALGLRLSPEQANALIAPYQPGEVAYASQ